ncbi:hypothetical protein [Vibrio cholerae]|uniref:hypothetical protein n=1 Tax=Vibrio cholerae TaxID=666 RepID=UPI000BA98915|nr:hypothetical protein [Vibrio cholerae]PAR92347.1 hypothetical protein CGT82_17155 [Vibrio cholerae]
MINLEPLLWIRKIDPEYKRYEKHQWKKISSVKLVSGDVYILLVKNKTFKMEKGKPLYLFPLCAIDKNYTDMLLSIDDEDLAYIWKDKKCFITDAECVKNIAKSEVKSEFSIENYSYIDAKKLVDESNINIRSYIGGGYWLLLFLFVFFVSLGGVYLWMF